jgi:hypothetical protein
MQKVKGKRLKVKGKRKKSKGPRGKDKGKVCQHTKLLTIDTRGRGVKVKRF